MEDKEPVKKRGRYDVTMKNKFLCVLSFFLSLPTLALSQSDPLSPTYAPFMDTNAAHYPSNIWITDTMQKVQQQVGSQGTAHWGTFHCTQNEFCDFQVHFRDTAGGTPNLSVAVSNFVQTGPASYTITASATRSSYIVVYREAYINIQTYVTNNQANGAVPGGVDYNTFYGAVGQYPDVLIPAVDPYWGQTTNAWPFTVAANQNQSAWVDVLIPPAAPSGYYLGTVTVKSGSTTLATMPVTIAVWQWPNRGAMPSTTTLKTVTIGAPSYNGMCTQMYSPGATGGGTTLCANYPGASGDNDSGNTWVFFDIDLLMKDHRYATSDKGNMYPQSGSFTSYNSRTSPILNGGCVTHGGAGNTCPLLASSVATARQLAYTGVSQSVWSAWQTDFNSQGWGPLLFDYLYDEPAGSAAFTTLTTNAATRHGYLNPGIPELVTNSIYFGQSSYSSSQTFQTSICGNPTCIQNSIDWMVVPINVLEPAPPYGSLQPLSLYSTWLNGSTAGIHRKFMSYLACSSAGTCSNAFVGPAPAGFSYVGWPNYDVDGKPAANRAMEWMTYLHGQTGELYYGVDICTSPSFYSSCVSGGASYDPWNGIYYSGGWGDGTLIYAGSTLNGSVNYMGSRVTTPIILPSVRLKHIRDGMQDYEYLNALTLAGRGSFVTGQINSWITNSYTFETSGAGLQAARLNLGIALHQLTYPVNLLPPLGPSGKVQ